MQICKAHWDTMRTSIADRGMEGLVAKSGKEALDNEMTQLESGESKFDPLMSMHWHWMDTALQCGGLSVLMPKPDGSQCCPICELAAHYEDFKPETEINSVADQMRVYCLENGLIARPQ